jgi:hypothetical protein
MNKQLRYSVELPEQDDPQIGQELIRVTHEDGHTEELRLHDYARVYEIPGLYEQIVHERLGCRSPVEIASMLAEAADRLGWDREAVRVIDLAAGNGVSGQALREQGLRPVLATDIVPEARAAALRDRSEVYDDYRILDLLNLRPDEERILAALNANAANCVAPVGTGSQQLPPPALLAAVRLLAADALVAYMHDPTPGEPDPITPELWARELGPATDAELLTERRYLHRYTVSGRRYEMVGKVWRVQRTPTTPESR